MDDKLFLIAIGGTGMRCLESFVHLCAAGLFDNKTIEILTIDTDQFNGNKARVENLIELYNKVKTNDPANKGGEQRSDTFFSAKLNLYRFYTDYSIPPRSTLYNLAHYSDGHVSPERRQENDDLSDLLFDRETVQRFSLEHGYRAQTHLGSMLMYHGIIESAVNAAKGDKDVKENEAALKQYLQLLSGHVNNARVFVFGSVFGGTGASSIPVIPVALRDALKIITGGNNELDLTKVKFGSTLLTAYFKFDSPTQTQTAQDKVIADSQNFALNSQAALAFYNKDATVKRSYKRLYHVGWPESLKINYSEGQSGDVVTGGGDQKNACHIAELICAAAAYDFFNDDADKLGQITEAQYVFRSVELSESGAMRLTGSSFVGMNHADVFENKLGALFSLAHLILGKYSGAYEGTDGTKRMLTDLSNLKVSQYDDLTIEQSKEIDEYLKKFAYQVVGGYFMPGWLYQIFLSIRNGSFLFRPEVFSTDLKALQNIDAGGLFNDEAHNWDKKGLLGSTASKRFDKLIDIMLQSHTEPNEKQGVTVKERFLAHLYNAITIAQHFNS